MGRIYITSITTPTLTLTALIAAQENFGNIIKTFINDVGEVNGNFNSLRQGL